MSVQLKLNKKETMLFFSQTIKDENSDDVLDLLRQQHVQKIFAKTEDTSFSSLLAAEIYQWRKICENNSITLDLSSLPKKLTDILSLSMKAANTPPAHSQSSLSFLLSVGQYSCLCLQKIKNALTFIYETFGSLVRFISGKAIYRRKDFWFIFADCSYKAVGITALVSFLVGLILAFVGALQLKTFGAGIYVASMVSLGMTRIMASIMVGIIMAGRTGSSFAATLGTMQVNEEIDALKTLGIKITDYLIAPRLVSLVLTIPFLTLLADALGIFGGAIVGICFLNISSAAYFDYAIKALSLTNILVGLLHSFIYGIIIALCGCYEGLNAGRDADAVGKATTGAVVTSLVWMIVATGILTVILEIFGI